MLLSLYQHYSVVVPPCATAGVIHSASVLQGFVYLYSNVYVVHRQTGTQARREVPTADKTRNIFVLPDQTVLNFPVDYHWLGSLAVYWERTVRKWWTVHVSLSCALWGFNQPGVMATTSYTAQCLDWPLVWKDLVLLVNNEEAFLFPSNNVLSHTALHSERRGHWKRLPADMTRSPPAENNSTFRKWYVNVD